MLTLLFATAHATCFPVFPSGPDTVELVDAQCEPIQGSPLPDFVYVRQVIHPTSVCCAQEECSGTEPAEGAPWVMQLQGEHWVQLDRTLEDDHRAACPDRPRRLDLRGLKPGTYRLAGGELVL